jgi:hypothetical protein
MIRVEIDLHVVHESETGFWLSDVDKRQIEELMEVNSVSFDNLRPLLRDNNVNFIYVDKNKDARNVISDRIGFHNSIYQVSNKWPFKLNFEKELTND